MTNEADRYRVNWQDGIKIDKEHFLDTDRFFMHQDMLSRSLILGENGYGLLPSVKESRPCLKLLLKNEGGKIRFTDYAFRVVMPGGMYADIDSAQFTELNCELEELSFEFDPGSRPESNYAVILRIDPSDGKAFGPMDSNSLPLYRPFLVPDFKLIIQALDKTKKALYGDDFLVLAHFAMDGPEIVMDQEYIPPSACLLAHEKLLKFYDTYYENIKLLEIFFLEIAKKYSRQKPGEFNDTLKSISSNMLMALAGVKVTSKHLLLYEPPIHLVSQIKHLANVFYYSLEIRTAIGKDKFLNEVVKILGTPKQSFENIIRQTVNLEYRHYDISASLEVLHEFMDLITRLFKSLSEYDKLKRNPDMII